MSGQYKIRRDSKGDDPHALYKVGRKTVRGNASLGGCVGGIKSCLGLVILLVICGFIFSLVGGASAQGNDEIRGPFKGICWFIKNNTTNDRITVPCPASKLNNTKKTVTPASSVKPNSGSCYAYSTVYITGNMNVRANASTSSAKVALATAGQSFSVTDSKKGGNYCWVKTYRGWIAKTDRVRSEGVRSTKGLPPIIGSKTHARKIEVAFTKLPVEWYNYVVAITKAIHVKDELDVPFAVAIVVALNPNAKVSALARSNGKIYFESESIQEMTLDVIASVLIHESCHLYQFNRNRSSDRNSEERECLELELEVALEDFPNSQRHIRDIRGYLDRARS